MSEADSRHQPFDKPALEARKLQLEVDKLSWEIAAKKQETRRWLSPVTVVALISLVGMSAGLILQGVNASYSRREAEIDKKALRLEAMELKTQVEAAKQQRDQYQNDLKTVLRELKTKTEEVANVQQQLAEMQGARSTLQAELRSLYIDKSAVGITVDDLQKALRDATEEYESRMRRAGEDPYPHRPK